MTNDFTEAIDLTSVHEGPSPDPTPDLAPDTTPGRSPRRHPRGRRIAAALAVGVVALGVGAALGLRGSDDPTVTGPRPAATATAALGAAATTGASTDAAPPSGDEVSQTEPDPAPPAEPGHLVVSTTYHGLETNDFSGTFEITNDGGSDVEWSWSGDVLVSVAPSGGVLAPGESVVVEFTVAWQSLPNGAFLYVSSVHSDEQSIVVTIAGNRDIAVNPGIELPKPQLTIDD